MAVIADGRPSVSIIAPAGISCILFVYEAVSQDPRPLRIMLTVWFCSNLQSSLARSKHQKTPSFRQLRRLLRLQLPPHRLNPLKVILHKLIHLILKKLYQLLL